MSGAEGFLRACERQTRRLTRRTAKSLNVCRDSGMRAVFHRPICAVLVSIRGPVPQRRLVSVRPSAPARRPGRCQLFGPSRGYRLASQRNYQGLLLLVEGALSVLSVLSLEKVPGGFAHCSEVCRFRSALLQSEGWSFRFFDVARAAHLEILRMRC